MALVGTTFISEVPNDLAEEEIKIDKMETNAQMDLEEISELENPLRFRVTNWQTELIHILPSKE